MLNKIHNAINININKIHKAISININKILTKVSILTLIKLTKISNINISYLANSLLFFSVKKRNKSVVRTCRQSERSPKSEERRKTFVAIQKMDPGLMAT